MDLFNGEAFTATLALLGMVIIVSALLSGLIERSGMPQVAAFLAIGAALGPAGLGALHVSLDSSALRIVATLSLTLVLFIDAVSLDVELCDCFLDYGGATAEMALLFTFVL
jgi:Kef-type K+ transport system membrane component KefB